MLVQKRKMRVMRLAMFALATALWSIGAMAQTNGRDYIKVGVIAPLSGPVAAQGKSTLEGVKAGIKYRDKVNGYPIKMVFLDDASDPSLTVRNARKLVHQENVDILLGTGSVPGALALASVAAEEHTPLVSWTPIPVPPEVAMWAKTTTQAPSIMVSTVLDAMVNNGVKTVGYIGFADSWGDIVYKKLKGYVKDSSLQVVAAERYARSDNRITAQIVKIMMNKPDAVLGGTAGTPGALPYIALDDRNYTGQIYGTYGLLDPEFVDLVGDAGNGLILSAGPVVVADQLPADNPSKEIIEQYRKAYEKTTGVSKNNDVMAAYAFDAWLVMLTAAEKIPADIKPGTQAYRNALREALNSINNLPTTQGVVTYRPDSAFGVEKGSVVIVKLQNGEWVLQQQ